MKLTPTLDIKMVDIVSQKIEAAKCAGFLCRRRHRGVAGSATNTPVGTGKIAARGTRLSKPAEELRSLV